MVACLWHLGAFVTYAIERLCDRGFFVCDRGHLVWIYLRLHWHLGA